MSTSTGAIKKDSIPTRKVLLLHGDRQTGDLLLGRISSLKRKLLKPRNCDQKSKNGGNGGSVDVKLDSSVDHRIELVAPDGPFVWELDPTIHHDSGNSISEERNAENKLMRTWWYREGDVYRGLDESLTMLHDLWMSNDGFEGILGFSRGARLTHLIAMLHEASNGVLFPNLKYIVSASGYGNVSLPSENFPPLSLSSLCSDNLKDMRTILPLSIKSMHIFGSRDRLVPVESSKALLPSYLDPVVHEHDGGHHIPMRAADVREILKFIDSASSASSNIKHIETYNKILNLETVTNVPATPDEEHAQLQIDECESMSLIFPEEFQLLSMVEDGTQNIVPGETNYKYPITYVIQLKPSPEQLEEEDDLKELWPKNDIALKVEYTAEYPDSLPIFSLQHDMNLLEFKISQETACLDTVKEAAMAETGMPCVMSCVYAAREFFEGGGLLSSSVVVASDNNDECEHGDKDIDDATAGQLEDHSLLRPSSVERIEKCKLEGLQISYNVAGYNSASILTSSSGNVETDDNKNETISGKGGSWKYTIGLVGKPSAGKSTFFNAATAFARQRGGDNADQDGIAIGGATMAPHPFTTIDPNVGYCLVPAPAGSCPEDDSVQDTIISCSHGRDSYGRRLLPVMLKDVAGLVPGAYQGRGRGNKFLDDLLDADVLIHVLDSSGTADTEGNKVVAEGDTSDDTSGSNPLNDIAWVHNELIEWIVSNLLRRWDTISRRGRHKLVNMFSGYKQSQAFVWDVLLSVERFLLNHEGRDHALDHLSSWDKGDLYRLVTAFLGVRFPTALALNKNDLPSSKLHCDNISQALPLHGAHIGIPMSADREMRFVRHHIYSAIAPEKRKKDEITENSPPKEVWNCLQSAIKLREPVLVFPVFDMENYQPLPGMFNFATRDASLPSLGMISCLEAAGGHAPSMWDTENNAYYSSPGDIESGQILRDCLIMKPNSTVEDVFDYLKRLGALGGEFVRAEAIGNVGEKPKLVKKDELVGKHNRILKIMTTKRREWQKAMSLIH